MTVLGRKVASGVKWSTVSQYGRQGVQIATTIVLARLLPPSDFGLLGMAMVAIGFIDIFKDLGTTAAVIQKQRLSDELLSSVFWVNVGFGIFAMALLFFCAPVAGLFYREVRVVALLQVLSVNFFISGVSILQQALLERSLAFQVLAKLETSSVICGAAVGIMSALAGAGVWSLVCQSLTTVSLSTIFLWRSSSWRPQWTFNWSEVKPISSFSMNLVGFNVFNYFARNADYLLIGRYLGAQDLGYYTLAYRILLLPIQSVSRVISRVVFPVYSNIQDDNQRFAMAYLRVAGVIALVSFPMMMGILALAEPFVTVVFGAKWRTTILLVMILAPVGLTQSIGTMVGTIYQAKGRTDWMFRWGITAGISGMIAFVIGLQWGIVGVATSYAIATFCLAYFNHAIPFRLIGLKFRRFLHALYRPFGGSLLMLLTIVLFRSSLPAEISDVLELGLCVAIGILVYALMNWAINRRQLQELWMLFWHKDQVI